MAVVAEVKTSLFEDGDGESPLLTVGRMNVICFGFCCLLFILRWMVETVVRNIYEQIKHLGLIQSLSMDE